MTLPVWSLFFVMGALWAFASPLGSSPDSPSQVARAASVVRGQWLGSPVPGPAASVTTVVRIPATYDLAKNVLHCYQFHQQVSAGCASAQLSSARTVPVKTHVGRYPPLYYLVVGWPSLLTSSVAGIYGMELASAAAGALFIALAFTAVLAWAPDRRLLLALAAAATPMCIYLMGTVNPSGLEVACALCMWVSMAVMLKWHLDRPPPGLVAIAASSAAVLVWARPEAFAWPLLAIFISAPLWWRRRAVKSLQISAPVVVAAVVVALSAAGALAWDVTARATSVLSNFSALPRGSSFGHILFYVATDIPWLALQAVGNFGWLDTPVPRLVVASWTVVCVWLVVMALRGRSGRERAVVSLALGAGYGFPLVTLALAAPSLGFIGQGRYFLPLWSGIPIMAGCVGWASTSDRGWRWTPWCLGGALMLAQVGSFYWALRRYVTGLGKSWALSGPAGKVWAGKVWAPPVPAWLLVALFAICCLGALAASGWWALRPELPGRSAGPPSRVVYAVAGTEPAVNAGTAPAGERHNPE